MIIGCGVDVVDIQRMENVIRKWDKHFLKKVFTPGEIRYCEKKKEGRYQSYAGLFAAKEALAKALGTGFRNMQWQDIEIKQNALGKPLINLSERFTDLKRNGNVHSVHLSISHTRKVAVAQVIIENVQDKLNF